jgi:hypothetical protein
MDTSKIHSIKIEGNQIMYYYKDDTVECYTAWLPEIPGCVVQANTIEDCEKEILISLNVINKYKLT